MYCLLLLPYSGWSQLSRPLVVLTISFGIGIAVELWSPVLKLAGCGLLGICCILCAVTKRAYWASSGIVLGFVLLGCLRCFSQEKLNFNDITQFDSGHKTVRGTVESDVLIRPSKSSDDRGSASFTVKIRDMDGMRNSDQSIDVFLILNGERKTLKESGAAFHPPFFGDLVELNGDLKYAAGARNPGGFDFAEREWRRGTSAALYITHPKDCTILPYKRFPDEPILWLAIKFRNLFKYRFNASFSAINSGLLQGILLGDKSGLSSRVLEDFERTGTEHILATAGLHVGIVVILIRGLFWRIGVQRKPAIIFTILLLILFALMAGGRPAVTRAALLAGIYLASILLEREFDIWNALALTALTILIWNPFQLFDAGFQLTFAAVITIAHLLPFGERLLNNAQYRMFHDKQPSRLFVLGFEIFAGSIMLSFAAQIGSLPLIAAYFHTFSLVSLLANSLSVPLLSIIIPLGFLSAVFPAIALILAPLLSLLIWVIQTCSGFSWSCFSAATPHPILIGSYYLVIWYGAWKLKKRLPLSKGDAAAVYKK